LLGSRRKETLKKQDRDGGFLGHNTVASWKGEVKKGKDLGKGIWGLFKDGTRKRGALKMSDIERKIASFGGGETGREEKGQSRGSYPGTKGRLPCKKSGQ